MVVSYEFILFFDRLGILETLPLYFFYTFGHVLEVTHREKTGRSGGLWSGWALVGPSVVAQGLLGIRAETLRCRNLAAVKQNILQRFEEGVETNPPRNQQEFQN